MVSFLGLTGFTNFTIQTASSEAYVLQIAVENEPLFRWQRIEINLKVLPPACNQSNSKLTKSQVQYKLDSVT